MSKIKSQLAKYQPIDFDKERAAADCYKYRNWFSVSLDDTRLEWHEMETLKIIGNRIYGSRHVSKT